MADPKLRREYLRDIHDESISIIRNTMNMIHEDPLAHAVVLNSIGKIGENKGRSMRGTMFREYLSNVWSDVKGSKPKKTTRFSGKDSQTDKAIEKKPIADIKKK